MAITSRAARVTTEQGALYTTPDVVGPGSYLKTDRSLPVHGYAPFSSTVNRLGEGGSAGSAKTTPGPGAYTTPLLNTIGRTPFVPNGVPAGAGAAFASKVSRLGSEGKEGKKVVPGPGQYSLRDDWQALQQKAAYRNRQPPQKRAPGGGGRAGAGAPSIPAHDQSFGYEETDEGELRMQRPPDGGYSGVSGHRSAGPGEYDPLKATSLTRRAGVMPDFGNSRVPRSLFSESRDVPGPGAYARDDGAGRARPSAAFLSRVPQSHQKLLDPEKLMPGPGAYAASPGITPKAVPENLQAFGSTQKRLASDAVTPSQRQQMAQPGPGAYNIGGTSFSGAGASAGPPGSAPSAADKSGRGFNSSTVRFTALDKSSKPGPGAYDELDQQSFVSQMSRKTHGRNGVFGSTTRRFHSLKRDPVPGAGTYNPTVPGSADGEREEGPSSAFASGVQRFAKSAPTRVSAKIGKVKDAVPPPWQYNPKSTNDWGAARKMNARESENFGSTTERFPAGELGGGKKIVQVPGPGQYAPKHPNEGFKKPPSTSMTFGTKEQRFGAKGAFAAPTPGPGSYENSAGLHNPLVKRSFNITIG